jgi:STE24 endopeptidase
VNEDKASRYHRLKRRALLASMGWTAALLVVVLTTGVTHQIRGAAEDLATAVGLSSPSIVVAAYVILLTLLHEIGGSIIGFYSEFLLERRYGLSTERFGGWVWDQAKSLLVGWVLLAPAAALLYAFIRRAPDHWWLPAGIAFSLLIVGLANLAPLLLLPLFYRVKPLDRDALRTRLLALAERAGARVLGAYEWGLGDKTRKANAALAGLGTTRRILVSDTMLADYSDDEIEIVLAHELAHHVHGDIWKGLAFESLLVIGGFFFSAHVLARFAGSFGLAGIADPAGVPLVVLSLGAVSVVMIPAAYALSRAFERSADRFALELTKNPAAFVSAMRRLAAQNLAEERPSRVTQWLFYSHPPVAERIAAAQAYGSYSRG